MELRHSAQRWSEATTLGDDVKLKTILKELWQRGSGWLICGQFPRVARLASATRTSQLWAEGWNPVGIHRVSQRTLPLPVKLSLRVNISLCF